MPKIYGVTKEDGRWQVWVFDYGPDATAWLMRARTREPRWLTTEETALAMTDHTTMNDAIYWRD